MRPSGAKNMLLTNREQEMIRLMMSQPAGISRDELERQLGVSRRTIYRELSQLEHDIATVHLKLDKGNGSSYRIVGAAADLASLSAALSHQRQDLTFDPSQRQSALTLMLLTTDETLTMTTLADAVDVSITTIKQDLDILEPALNEYHLKLNRQKAAGIWIEGQEGDIRRVLVGVLNAEINPYVFFRFLNDPQQDFDPVTNYFIERLPQEELLAANTALSQIKALADLNDNQRKAVLLTVAINTRRLREDHHVKPQQHFDQERLFQDQQLALQFLAEMDSTIREKVRVGDYQFLAIELSNIRGGLAGEPVDQFDLTINLEVQDLIREVARSFPGKFSGNPQLYSSLLAHVQRTAGGDWLSGVTMTNPVLAHLQDDYPELYQAVQKAADHVFGQGAFTGDALAYLVLYFASVLDHAPAEKPVAVLLVTSDGPGTGSLIAGKLRVQVPEIRKIKIVQVSDLPEQQLEHYDLVLATMPLPGFKHQYLVITPILGREEIAEVRRLVQRATPKQVRPLNQPSLDQTVTAFESLKTMVMAADGLLQHFAVNDLNEPATTIAAAIDAMLAQLPTVVVEPPIVKEALLKRLELAPVGIPNTGLAMIHTSSRGVTTPYIGAFDLKTAIPLAAMDMGTIQLQRILLLLTPNPVPQETLTLLSAVSAKLVASPADIQLFEKGHYSQLYQVMTEVFMHEIQKIDRR